MIRGKLIILGIFGLSLAAAFSSIGYHYLESRRSMAFWGGPAAVLIARSPEGQAWLLKPSSSGGAAEAKAADAKAAVKRSQVRVVDADCVIEDRKDVIKARGFGNIRRALVQDASFHWDEQPLHDLGGWRYALHFSDDEKQATVAFDSDVQRAVLLEGGAPIALDPAVSNSLRGFFADQFPAEAR